MLSEIKPYDKLPFHGVLLPTIQIAPEDKEKYGIPVESTNLEFITQLCRSTYKEKVANRIAKEKQPEYVARIKMELDTIETLGFTNYILMFWDICRFADEAGIPRGPGRGSVSSSLVCYLLGITEADPIQTGLFFTRFLSKARAKVSIVDGVKYVDGSLTPDIDMDFDYYRREEILAYLGKRYEGQTSKLLTTTTFTSKILIKDVLKIYEGATEDKANEASDLIEKEAGIPEEIEDALSANEDKENKRFKEWAENHKETCEIAMGLSGLNRSEGMHASALLICAYKIDDLMPLQLSGGSSEKESISGLDMYSAQEVVLKFDILGLKTLSVIADVCKRLKIKRNEIDVHDSSIYRLLQNFKYRYGIFQLETFAQGNAAEKIHPMNFEQLTACLAIARPGAFAYIDQYCKCIHDGTYNSIHPLIDDILKPTGGVCIYQEQYLAMLIRVGMTPDEAEIARKVLGKKQKEKVPEIIAKIEDVCKRNNHPREIIDVLVKIAYDSGGYQFALAHSVAYAMLTAYTLYLKANYPLEFYWALLRMAKNESDSHTVISEIEKEMRAAGFSLLPPHFVHSSLDFKIESDKSIRFGLGLIRGVSDKSMEKLESFRGQVASTKFETFQSLKNSGLNIGIGSALIQAGCMDGFETYTDGSAAPVKSRSRLVLELCTWNILTDKEKRFALDIASKPEVNWEVIKAIKYLSKQLDDKGKPIIKETRLETIRKKFKGYQEIFNMNSRNERLANFWYERRILGYSYSENLKNIFSAHIESLVSVDEARNANNEERVKLIGFVKEKPYKSKTKAGNDSLKFVLADETGELVVRMFNDRIDQCKESNGRLPDEEDLIIMKGKKMDGDTIFADEVGIQTTKIYMKLSELKDKLKEEKTETQIL